jgi:hypothetical protein
VYCCSPHPTVYTNDPEIPGLQIHLGLDVFVPDGSALCFSRTGHDVGHGSFDWRLIMTRFFAKEAYVRRRHVPARAVEHSRRRLEELLDVADLTIQLQCPSLADQDLNRERTRYT